MRFFIAILTSFMLLFSFSLKAGDLSSPLREITLSNGMKVLFKQIAEEDEDVEVHLIAQGGWAGFVHAEKTNARIASEVLWESGFANLTPDQIHALMWLHSVELSSDIKPFSRTIDGNASIEGVDTLFKLINALFTSPKFTDSALTDVKRKVAETLRFQPYDANYTFDYFSKALNTAHFKGFRQLNINSLKRKTNIELMRNVYGRCFGDPSEFRVFISGHFNESEIESLVKKYLEPIPKKVAEPLMMSAEENGLPHFPEGISRLEVPSLQIGYNESLIRVTFPIDVSLNKNNFTNVLILSKLIDKRLNKELEKKGLVGEGYCISTYDFPLYPYLQETWITIQSRSTAVGSFTDPLEVEKTIIAILTDLKKNGPTDEELSFLNSLIKERQDNFSENDDLLKLFLIQEESLAAEENQAIKKEYVVKIVSELIDLKHYSVIYSEK